jgi:hypothetical protein
MSKLPDVAAIGTPAPFVYFPERRVPAFALRPNNGVDFTQTELRHILGGPYQVVVRDDCQLVMHQHRFVCYRDGARWIPLEPLVLNERFAEFVGTVLVFDRNVKIVPDPERVSFYSTHRFSHDVHVKNTVDSSSDARVCRFMA